MNLLIGRGHLWEIEVVNELEQDFDVDRFRHEGVVARAKSALTILVTRVTRDGDCGNVVHSGKNFKLFEELITIDVGHADVRNNYRRTFVNGLLQRFGGRSSGRNVCAFATEHRAQEHQSVERVFDYQHVQAN